MITSKFLYHKLAWLICFSLTSFLTHAQDSVAVQNQPVPSTAPVLPYTANVQASAATQLNPEVLDVRVLKVDTTTVGAVKKQNIAYADDIVEIKISHPTQFLLLRPSDQSRLVLYADGMQLKGIRSYRFEMLSRQDVASGQITLPDTMWIPFQLKRDSSTQSSWKSLYHIANHWYSYKITFQANLGWEGMFPLTSHSRKVDSALTVVFYEKPVYWIWLTFYAFFIVLFIYLCANTNLIREACDDNKGAFSLSQTQLVFWTVLVIGGFIYSVVLTDLTNSLNPSVLLLLGISIGTTGVANSINYYKKQKGTVSSKKHTNFLFDILSDGDSLSVHRTQILMWNLVFGIYFIIYTINNKTMPEFSDTILVLSGVSSTFYLGSKVTENGNGNINVIGSNIPPGGSPSDANSTPDGWNTGNAQNFAAAPVSGNTNVPANPVYPQPDLSTSPVNDASVNQANLPPTTGDATIIGTTTGTDNSANPQVSGT